MIFNILFFAFGILVAKLYDIRSGFGNSKKNQPQITKRKYLQVDFEDGGYRYNYIVPYNRLEAIKDIKVIGQNSKNVYNFHSGLIPKIPASLLSEGNFIVTIDGQEMVVDNLQKIFST